MRFVFVIVVLTAIVSFSSCYGPREATSCPGPRNRAPKHFSMAPGNMPQTLPACEIAAR